MRCKKFRDIILTDYLDGAISVEKRREVREHLKQCIGCRELEAAAKNSTVEPFSAAQKASPSQALWQKIKAEIEQEQHRESQNPLLGLLDRLKSLSIFPRPAFALAAATVVIIVAVSITRFNFVNQKSAINDYLEEQVTFLASLEGEHAGYDNGYLDFGTGIEEFLL